MIEYTKYNTTTGEILEGGSTGALLTDIPLEEGQSIIEGIYDVGTYKIIDGVAVEQSIDIWQGARFERNTLLTESDWTQMPDSPLSSSKKTEWATYRQALRDLPSTSSASTYEDIVWPTEPS